MLDSDMLDLDMLVLDTLLLDMVVLAILVLVIMARDLLMLNPKPRLMLVSFMEDMDMVDLDMPDSDMPDLDMPDLDMLVLAILVLAIMARDLPKLIFFIIRKQKLKLISGWHFVIQCPLLEVQEFVLSLK